MFSRSPQKKKEAGILKWLPSTSGKTWNSRSSSVITTPYNKLSGCRLDDIVKTKEDSEYSRLSHYNKGLKLLKETLDSEKSRHKGKKNIVIVCPLSCVLCPASSEKDSTRLFDSVPPQLLPGATSGSCWRGRMSSTRFPCLCTTLASQPQTLCPVLEQ